MMEQNVAGVPHNSNSRIAEGEVFDSVEDVKNAVALYNNENFTEFVVETNNKKSLIFKCKNGVY